MVHATTWIHWSRENVRKWNNTFPSSSCCKANSKQKMNQNQIYRGTCLEILEQNPWFHQICYNEMQFISRDICNLIFMNCTISESQIHVAQLNCFTVTWAKILKGGSDTCRWDFRWGHSVVSWHRILPWRIWSKAKWPFSLHLDVFLGRISNSSRCSVAVSRPSHWPTSLNQH